MRHVFLPSILVLFSLPGSMYAQPPAAADSYVTLGKPVPLYPQSPKQIRLATTNSPPTPPPNSTQAPPVGNSALLPVAAALQPVAASQPDKESYPVAAVQPTDELQSVSAPHPIIASPPSGDLQPITISQPAVPLQPLPQRPPAGAIPAIPERPPAGAGQPIRSLPPVAPETPTPPGPLPNCCEQICAPYFCGPSGRIWGSAEYLLWWFGGNHVPPLVTTSPPASAGVLGAPGTAVLFGGSSLDEDAHSGGRFTVGFWLNDCQTLGVEANYFFLGSRSVDFTAGGSGLPGSAVIARPVINGLTGAETAQLVNFPGAEAGNVSFNYSSRLQGAGVTGIANVCCDCCYRLDVFGGFRYLELREGIGEAENIAVNPGVPVIGGSRLSVTDQFDTRNQFYGGQFGARAEYRRGNVFVGLTGSIALGTTSEEIDIRGRTVIVPAAGPATTLNGGVLALPSNIGHFSRCRFAVVPEVGLNVGYQLTDHIRAFVGYSFIYVSNVARPGNLIDRTVNLTQLPSILGPGTLVGPARPALELKSTDFWAQGINSGLEIRY